ncbi:hypothetical protein G5B47_24715 [Paenibacillus sp. 7124]|uniref:Uncharacterized protein n=1 Tax=Paenibacillus apii TaxID=1850370 RepID=A0A6M1PQP9_9BACL|nr:hypothetical protein [Paenibacillus apii]NGM85606.1 hypothetical protein [Paenibacillus apii]NJJ40700.1 hypothetical protein [Paenibacillus apii]
MGFWKNVTTFGAAGRIERKEEEFEDLRERYESLYEQMENKRHEVNAILQEVIKIKVKAVKSLSKINQISKNLKGREREYIFREIGSDFESVNFNQINSTVSAGQVALNATKGISAGVGSALGAWALVSTLGTASTGTAIAGLSGAAATNATLAWFGGGALAAGGGGIAAGTAVLGGIVAVPALILMGAFSHVQASKKIKQIEQEMHKILKAMDQIEANLLNMRLIQDRAAELIPSIEKARIVFIGELKRTHRELNRLFGLVNLIRWFRSKVLKKSYYTGDDLKKIAYIGGIATDFATLIDTPIFEGEAAV